MSEPDLSAIPDDASTSTIAALGRALIAAETEVARLEVELKKAKRLRDQLSERDLPEACEALGIEKIQVDGCLFEMDEIFRVQPPVANRPLVLQELEKQGAGALIKSEVTVSFPRGKEAEAKALIERLTAEGLQPKQEKWVESSTLKKHVRERLEAGKAVDMELFGVHKAPVVSITDGAPKPPVFDGEA